MMTKAGMGSQPAGVGADFLPPFSASTTPTQQDSRAPHMALTCDAERSDHRAVDGHPSRSSGRQQQLHRLVVLHVGSQQAEHAGGVDSKLHGSERGAGGMC